MAVLATAVWRVRPSGSDTNGGGYDSGIAGAATDYSKQDAAQATGTVGTAAGTTTFTDAGGLFTAAMVGNALWIASGAGFTPGAYFITARASSTSITLDRSPGTGSAAQWKVGGGWATFANVASTGPCVDGNIVNVLGTATPNPASYAYDYDVTASITFGASITIQNDSATPGYKAPPDTTGGMPVIKFDVADHMFKSGVQNNITIQGLYFVGTTTAAAKYAINNNVSSAGAFAKGSTFIFGCVLDQFSFDVGLALSSTTGFFGTFVFGSEVFSSAAGSTGSQAAAFAQAQDLSVDSCNFHDCIGHGVSTGSGSPAVTIIGSIIAKCQSNGVNYGSIGTLVLKNNTIDGNLGHGLIVTNANENNNNNNVANNIFSNHTQAGKFGIDIQVNAGAATTGFFDYNVFYNNTSNYNNLTAGVHDTALGVTPYVGQPTENYTLA